MALTRQTMTDEQRKSVAIEYLKAYDNGGVTSTGGSILDLFADRRAGLLPEVGHRERARADRQAVRRRRQPRQVDHAPLRELQLDLLAAATCSPSKAPATASTRDGPWRAGVPEWGAGRWCDVFEIRDWLIQRCFIYLDPDYAGKDTARYPWLKT